MIVGKCSPRGRIKEREGCRPGRERQFMEDEKRRM